mmetsp:Transcript_518/g.535  ORF Transcript_518/g.535 Transcript_518/m.535 type:complete len:218 (-) Transcript_518:239-892(-)
MLFIDVRDHAIQISIEDLCVDPLEVTAEEHHYFVCSEVLLVVVHELVPFLVHIFSVEASHSAVILEGVVSKVEIESVGTEIQVTRDEVSQDLRAGAVLVHHIIRSLDPLQFLVLSTLSSLTFVHASEEPGGESQLIEDLSIGVRVPERIDLPASLGGDSKLILHPELAELHVGDHIFEASAGLIMHGPASIEEFELTISDELSNFGLLRESLLFPPF